LEKERKAAEEEAKKQLQRDKKEAEKAEKLAAEKAAAEEKALAEAEKAAFEKATAEDKAAAAKMTRGEKRSFFNFLRKKPKSKSLSDLNEDAPRPSEEEPG
jgi:colicin import membrane protein